MTHGIQFREPGLSAWSGVEHTSPRTTAEAREQMAHLHHHELCGLARSRCYEVRHLRHGVIVACWRVGA